MKNFSSLVSKYFFQMTAAWFWLVGAASAFKAKAADSGVTIPTDTGLPTATIPEILKGMVKWLLLIFGLVAIISFVISGILYLTSAGDDDRQETAKRQMQYSIIGVIVGLSGYIVIKAVDTWLRASSTQF